jgi:hypothetical protein
MVKMERKLYCFVSIPFGPPDPPGYVEDIFSLVRRVLEERGYTAKRLDTLGSASSPVVERLQDTISNSSFVIGLLSENKNTGFEIGVAVGLGKDDILLAPSEVMPPYELSGMPVLFFDKGNVEELEAKLSTQVSNLHKLSSRKGNYSRSLLYLEHELTLAKKRDNDRDVAAVLNK